MDASLENESEKLSRSWLRHEQTWLRDYLVGSVEDPRLNVQSILTRHFLIERLGEGSHARLMEGELRFAIAMNWILRRLEAGFGADEFALVLHALNAGADNAEGIEVPAYLLEAFEALGSTDFGLVQGNCLTNILNRLAASQQVTLRETDEMDTFMWLWSDALRQVNPTGLKVLEAACGSANDYRAIQSCGLARLIGYRGFDLCQKNIANARTLFPNATFTVGNVFGIDAPDRSFDATFTHDLFEHLSADGIQVAANELCRVTRSCLIVGFFNMHEEDETTIIPVEDYHWNALSAPRLREVFEAEGFRVQILSIDAFLSRQFDCEDTHNKNAYSFRCERVQG